MHISNLVSLLSRPVNQPCLPLHLLSTWVSLLLLARVFLRPRLAHQPGFFTARHQCGLLYCSARRTGSLYTARPTKLSLTQASPRLPLSCTSTNLGFFTASSDDRICLLLPPRGVSILPRPAPTNLVSTAPFFTALPNDLGLSILLVPLA
jgi:hypothetical protein